jgi:hypothetical protein
VVGSNWQRLTKFLAKPANRGVVVSAQAVARLLKPALKPWVKQDQGMTLDEQRAEILRLLLALPPKRQICAIDKLRKMATGGNSNA